MYGSCLFPLLILRHFYHSLYYTDLALIPPHLYVSRTSSHLTPPIIQSRYSVPHWSCTSHSYSLLLSTHWRWFDQCFSCYFSSGEGISPSRCWGVGDCRLCRRPVSGQQDLRASFRGPRIRHCTPEDRAAWRWVPFFDSNWMNIVDIFNDLIFVVSAFSWCGVSTCKLGVVCSMIMECVWLIATENCLSLTHFANDLKLC